MLVCHLPSFNIGCSDVLVKLLPSDWEVQAPLARVKPKTLTLVVFTPAKNWAFRSENHWSIGYDVTAHSVATARHVVLNILFLQEVPHVSPYYLGHLCYMIST
jgi:hypothetical protein